MAGVNIGLWSKHLWWAHSVAGSGPRTDQGPEKDRDRTDLGLVRTGLIISPVPVPVPVLAEVPGHVGPVRTGPDRSWTPLI